MTLTVRKRFLGKTHELFELIQNVVGICVMLIFKKSVLTNIGKHITGKLFGTIVEFNLAYKQKSPPTYADRLYFFFAIGVIPLGLEPRTP